MSSVKYIAWFDELRMTDTNSVGGKNASLGEMISQLSGAGVRVPGGFATTANAYRDFLAQDNLAQRIEETLALLDVSDVALLSRTGTQIRKWIMGISLPQRLQEEISAAYEKMLISAGTRNISVAVRSSATAEDLVDASFAGQQETFLNITSLDSLLTAVRSVYASLYNDRAISYRVHHGFAHADVALSVGVQRMVRSDLGASGVMFTLDTESGFDQVVFITASYGLGEAVVQGIVNPDEFYVYKPTLKQGKPAILKRNLGTKLIQIQYAENDGTQRTVSTHDVDETKRAQFSITDKEVEELARHALVIEAHYQRPMDIEWGKDGLDGKLYILQARPETVQSRASLERLESYQLKNKSEILVSGYAIGQKIGSGRVRLILNPEEMSCVEEGDTLVTDMTDPDWEPVMKRAAAIVTNRGGRTCHAAIIARELGIPAVVGCGNATSVLAERRMVTVSCAEGNIGNIYDGALEVEITELVLDSMPQSPVKISMNIGNPGLAFDLRRMPNDGIGLARLEFIIARMIGVHPKAILAYPDIPIELKQAIEKCSMGYSNPVRFYVDKLTECIATLAAAFFPKPVIVRLSDFKSNEYANLVGGKDYEPSEENPMLGFRGASRYIAESFRDCFRLECEALRKVRDEMGLTNVEIMIPFVRTLAEARQVIALLEENGLRRGEQGLRLIMMCEVPSNALLADEFLQYFDGFSIGSNDLTQLTLGLDRDSGLVSASFDERDPAVKVLLRLAIQACLKANKYIGVCGQGPSDHPDLANWLMEEGVQNLSLNPDSVMQTWLYLANQADKKRSR
ncbi:phosphoenolpyruvate synthase [Nitrosomonas cryotolerans]|uniref:Phosphoenolpyruvate synthase n=1 Tax=Nitrosomonas cryotolerans ATCC 49181 TaxID=1131553 RepID=A0A1N6J593_9PROT|nr:phosphoenolpyruvate synthase [Nitrosomonas cryotolerans]SFP46107.1 phosphoenolpyruvate synthase [Nitrosomonas cryotolerans]SIO39402.1 phosphoenolpyruvate synthase [Nitrosomonas cryotolerans ATCC 49181]